MLYCVYVMFTMNIITLFYDGWFHCMCAIIMGSGVCTGNLHQPQYCDKIKSIVEFLNTKLSLEELSTIWEMQVCEYCVCVCVRVSVLVCAYVNTHVCVWCTIPYMGSRVGTV